LPKTHVDYLTLLRDQWNFNPKVIYDLGACVLHWTNEAKLIWTESTCIAFEAMESAEFLFQEKNIPYYIGVLSDTTGKEVDFYCNDYHPGGNSYYKANTEVVPDAEEYYNESNLNKRKTITLDDAVKQKGFPPPDLIKMDVQGAELDILKGAQETLKYAKHVILELQHVEFNAGAPLRDEVIAYMDSIGFNCIAMFSNNGPDADYHFARR
jgi:FkbM family methyltransferase